MDLCGQQIGLVELTRHGRFDLLVTGAAAISTNGIRFGKGHGYFDLEWAMFSEARCLAENPLVVCAVHDCQVVDLDLVGSEFDTRVDLIVTPTRTIFIPAQFGDRKSTRLNSSHT